MDTKPEQYVSDVITEEEYSKWTGKIVFLPAGTGRGKTTFILDEYIPYLVNALKKTKILYLCNRKALKNQIEKKAAKEGINITVDTYQSLEYKYKYTNFDDEIPVLDYDAYVMDEAHYFLSDSTFNLYTDVSYNLIMGQKNKTRLFMSATGFDIFNHICEELDNRDEDYIFAAKYDNLRTDYSYVSKVYWYNSAEQYESILKHIDKQKGEKALIFGDSLKKYKHFTKVMSMKEKSYYFYGESLKKFFGRKRIARVTDYYEDKQKHYLVTTTAMDNGIDIKCEKVKHIICDIFDINILIQCLGRKRTEDEHDTCTFYIKVPDQNELEHNIKEYRKNINEIEFFKNSRDDWKKQYVLDRKKHSQNIYEIDRNGVIDFKVNELRYANYTVKEKLLTEILNKENIDITFKTEVQKVLNLDESLYSDFQIRPENSDVAKELRIFLEKHVDEYLTEDKKKRLTTKCGVETSSTKGTGFPTKINERIKELGINDYELVTGTKRNKSTRTTAKKKQLFGETNKDYGKVVGYWMIVRKADDKNFADKVALEEDIS